MKHLNTSILVAIILCLFFSPGAYANPLPGLEESPSLLVWGVSILMAFLAEITVILLIIAPIGISWIRLGTALLIVELPLWVVFRLMLDAFVRAELALVFRPPSNLPDTVYAEAMHALPWILGVEIIVVMIDTLLVFVFVKFSWFRTPPNQRLTWRKAFLASLLGNTISAILPAMIAGGSVAEMFTPGP